MKAALLVCLLMLTAPVSAERAIVIRRAVPAIAFAPASLHVEVTVWPDQENRAVVVVCDGPNYYRSSGWTIEGEQAPILYVVDWRDLPAGAYDVIAVVLSSTKERGRATARVQRAEP